MAEGVTDGPVVDVLEERIGEPDPLLSGYWSLRDDDGPEDLLFVGLRLPVEDLLPTVLDDLRCYAPDRRHPHPQYVLLPGDELGVELGEPRLGGFLSRSRSLCFMAVPPA